MDSSTAKLMAEYNSFANGKMNGFLAKLNDGQWNREFPGYFKTTRSICNHLYISDFTWLRRFSGLRKFSYAADELMGEKIEFGMSIVGDPTDYVAKRGKLDTLLLRFSLEITPQDIGSVLSYKDSHGNGHIKNFGGLVMHMFNHETHHRGMISLYLENLGFENDFNSLSEMIPEEKGQ